MCTQILGFEKITKNPRSGIYIASSAPWVRCGRTNPLMATPDRCRTCGKPQSGLGNTRSQARSTGGDVYHQIWGFSSFVKSKDLCTP